MDITFVSGHQDLKDWIEGSLSETLLEQATGFSIHFEYDKSNSDEEIFDDSICFMEFTIIGGFFNITRPMKYSEIVALRDYLNIVIETHRTNHIEMMNK